jgi:hypothetical protein
MQQHPAGLTERRDAKKKGGEYRVRLSKNRFLNRH